MKLIDLLVKISRGEEVPNKIKFDNKIYEIDTTYDNNIKQMYYTKEEKYSVALGGSEDCNILFHINDEVEIIEEDKKIEPFDMFDNFTGFSYGNVPLELRKDLENNFQKLNEVISELINEVNELKKGK